MCRDDPNNLCIKIKHIAIPRYKHRNIIFGSIHEKKMEKLVKNDGEQHPFSKHL